MTSVTQPSVPQAPSLGDQVTRLYDIIGGYHATHMLKIGQDLGVWKTITSRPGITSAGIAQAVSIEPFYTDALCRTAFAFGILDREHTGWRMAPHFDQILGTPDSTFYLGEAAGVHMVVGEDYSGYAAHFRDGTRSSYQAHGEEFMRSVASALVALPRIFLDFVLPGLPELESRLRSGGRLLDIGCGGGWAIVQFAERFPELRCRGVDIEPFSVQMAKELVSARGLEARCEADVDYSPGGWLPCWSGPP